MAKRRLVLIEWEDSHSGRGWRPLDEIAAGAEPLYCRSVGWLIAEKNGTKVLAASVSGERNGTIVECGTCEITIPEKAIIKMRTLRV